MLGSVTKEGSKTEKPASPSAESSTGLSKEEIFEVLSNHRRRYAMHHLIQTGETTLGELAEHVAAWEYGKTPQTVSSEERKRVYCALQQSHLPKMDTSNVVEFDKNRGVVAPTDAAEDLDIYLDVVEGDEIPWSQFYLGLSAVALAFIAAIWLGAFPFVLLPDLLPGALLAVAFTLSSVAHFLHARNEKLGSNGRPPEIKRN